MLSVILIRVFTETVESLKVISIGFSSNTKKLRAGLGKRWVGVGYVREVQFSANTKTDYCIFLQVLPGDFKLHVTAIKKSLFDLIKGDHIVSITDIMRCRP